MFKKMAMDRRMACMLRCLTRSLQDKPLHEHFGVHGTYTLEQTGLSTFHLNVHRRKSMLYKFKGIPEVLEQYISSFLHQHFVCSIEMKYEDVFRPPRFKMLHYDSNLYINMENLLCIHNKKYQQDWSLAFTLEKDILYLICLIVSAIH